MKIHAAVVLAFVCMLLLGGVTARAQDATQAAPDPIETLARALRDDPQAAVESAAQARDAAIAAWPVGEIRTLVEAVERHAIVQMIAGMPASARLQMTETWEGHPAFVSAIARVITPTNDAASVATLSQAIAAEHGDVLDQYAQLAAAVCVVLDRPHEFPGLGALRTDAAEVFEALVFADADRRVTALDLDALPAEVLVYLPDLALTGEGLRAVIQERRATDPLELYGDVGYVQPGLLAGEAAPTAEEFTFERIAERGGSGPLRSFYAEQLGQAFGWPVAIATGRLGEARFQAPVFLESTRRGYAWNLQAIPDHPGLAFGSTKHPVTGEPMALAALLVTADLATAGPDDTRTCWALMLAAGVAGPEARPAMLQAAAERTLGFPELWRELLAAKWDSARDDPEGPQRVLADFFERADQLSPVLATQMALERIASAGVAREDLLAWMALTSRRDPHRLAAAQLALGDALLERGDPAGAAKTYEELLNRHADATPLAIEALARLDSLIRQDGRDVELFELYARTHRRLRAPRTNQEAEVRASAFMIVGERYERLLIDAGREREAERLRRQLDRALP